MNLYIFLMFILAFFSACNSEYGGMHRISSRPSFIKQFGSQLGDDCNDIVIDRYENIICSGGTQGSLGGVNKGGTDAFIAKFNRQGKLLWLRQFGTNSTDYCAGVGVDYNGNIYCGGQTYGLLGTLPVDRRDDSGNNIGRVAADADQDAMVAKLSPSGDIEWIKQFGSTGSDQCSNFAVSTAGMVYCGSRTDGVMGVNFATGLYEQPSGAEDPMIAKLDSDGNILWVRQLGVRELGAEIAAGSDHCAGFTIDENENAYCIGGTDTNLGDTNGSSMDVFIWVVNADGFRVLLEQIGVAADANPEVMHVNAYESGLNVAVDKEGNIYGTALITGNLGEGSGGGQDGAVIKWDKNGNLEWVTQLGATTIINGPNSGNQAFQGITVTPEGNIVVVGSTSSDTVKTSEGADDVLIIAFNPGGEIIWANQIGSSLVDTCMSATTDDAGNIYCAGYTNGIIGEDSSGGIDAFILRLTPQGQLSPPL